ncbi:MAG: DUF1553 domain-containing protein [Candidatus Omnitrophica bacterium]|nr:DUF1553 domain-containing protein [Candidatus Omnitrophota bacterium]
MKVKRTVFCLSLAVAYLMMRGLAPDNAAASEPVSAYLSDMKVNNHIDELVSARLKKSIGTLPAPEEVRLFLSERNPDKRGRLINELLEREEYSDYWAMKWSDLLRVKSEFPSNLWPNGVQAYHRWIKEALKDNMPYDQFARSLLTSSGSNFREPPVNFYRVIPQHDPEKIAEFAVLIFMGMRTQKWTPEQRRAAADFFTQINFKKTGEWKEEIVYYDPEGPSLNTVNSPIRSAGILGETIAIAPGADPRVGFADWLTAPDNPYFSRNIVNRIWCWLLGRGIVNEADDIRPDNLPQNPELLDWLARELAGHKYDLKHIYRLILNSATYQLSSAPNRYNAADEVNFSHYPVRRLDAEVLIDAVCQVTGTGENYFSRIPEPFTFIPPQQRTIALADGSIDSSFLALFGRSPRATGYLSERNNESSVIQRLHFLNSTHIQSKIYRSQFKKRLVKLHQDDDQLIKLIYVSVLSRPPTDTEYEVVQEYMKNSGLNKEEAVGDLIWALINTKEFMFRH